MPSRALCKKNVMKPFQNPQVVGLSLLQSAKLAQFIPLIAGLKWIVQILRSASLSAFRQKTQNLLTWWF
jgi:hypothetical protein